MDDAASPHSFQTYLDELTALASREDRKADLLEAKAEFVKLTGEVFEDDPHFDQRMASFLDYYLMDRPSPLSGGKAPAVALYEEAQRTGPPERVSGLRGFAETMHALFEVRKIGKGLVRLRELFSGKDYDVTERRQLAGLEKGDIIEARLVPFNGMLLFSAAFCCHPKGSFKQIWKEVKRRKKKEPERPARDMVWECAKRAVKVDRYRQIPVEKIYDFENKTI